MSLINPCSIRAYKQNLPCDKFYTKKDYIMYLIIKTPLDRLIADKIDLSIPETVDNLAHAISEGVPALLVRDLSQVESFCGIPLSTIKDMSNER